MKVAVTEGPGGASETFENVKGVIIGIVRTDRSDCAFIGAVPVDAIRATAYAIAELRKQGGQAAVDTALQLSTKVVEPTSKSGLVDQTGRRL
jgi:hypothetical protein